MDKEVEKLIIQELQALAADIKAMREETTEALRQISKTIDFATLKKYLERPTIVQRDPPISTQTDSKAPLWSRLRSLDRDSV